jgi:AcrR family transcriptional regulator
MARPREFDETAVVQAARDLFWLHGFNGTSLDDLTVVTGLGRGSLYAAFNDKRDLFLRALDDYATMVMGQLLADLRDPEKNGRDRLVDHIRSITKLVGADTKGRGCLMAKSAAEMGATDKEVAQRVRKWLNAYQRDLAEAIREAQRDGDIDPDVDPRRAGTEAGDDDRRVHVRQATAELVTQDGRGHHDRRPHRVGRVRAQHTC